ncbi:uncharacterized protein LOC132557798 [Ylistrum balloti]|uniref:uncharacterized protein LOC132557798 n=1 Tax=Ylistrum balloti TaxID=509963 RepID=UPI002905CC4C|nr:uncharacterized protein LOC132557798 [Ylistrum balloti]
MKWFICVLHSVLHIRIESAAMQETIFTTFCGEDVSVFSEMNQTVQVNSAIECARNCIHMAPSIGGICEAINICYENSDSICELLFTPVHGIDIVYAVPRHGCVFYGRKNGNITCLNDLDIANGSSLSPCSSDGITDNTLHENSVDPSGSSSQGTTDRTTHGNSVNTSGSSSHGTTPQNQNENAMMWPKGMFTLLQPTTGCPNGWSTGLIQFEMQTNGTSYHASNYLKGTVNNNLVQWHFCTKTSQDGLEDWPEGAYCILRHGGTCPTYFISGVVAFDEEDDGNINNRLHDGSLPDIDSRFDDTALLFCCRNDGSASSTNVTLPISDPFYLFPYYNGDCPVVPGMNIVEEFTYFDCENTQNINFVAGATPLDVIASNHKINYCYYYQ